MMSDPSADRVIGLYVDQADGWITDRGRVLGRGGIGLSEGDRFDLFADALPPGGSVLDVGCGSGWPVGATLLERGFRVTGIDASPGLLAHAVETLPQGEWIHGDMRTLDLGRRFDGLLAWNSLFHLTPDDQRIALPRILSHAADRCVIMMSTGPEHGEVIGEWRGEPLYHGSLAPEDYAAILTDHGFVADLIPAEENSDEAIVWMARRAC